MPHEFDVQREAQLSLVRLLPRLQPLFDDPAQYTRFTARLNDHFPRVFDLLHRLYGDRYDFFYHLEQILITTAQSFIARDDDLHALDATRETDYDWFKSHRMIGYVCYVDLFAGDLAGLRDKIPYFKAMGITYLHLMPLFRAPLTNNDGGYAVSDYRQVDAQLGTMDDLRALSRALREEGISLVIDFVFNHTSDEHDWALKALQGDPYHQRLYYIFPDRTLPDQYQPYLREIFPEQAPGAFTYRPEIESWVWTTFNTFQWDLNYSNPETFNAMLGEMLFLANAGVEVLRLDAVAFIWKQLGTPSENLPPVHWIIQAYNGLTKIAAPALLFKSEAIVHPDDVVSYISWEECPISYNPTFMALLWEALATREVKLLRHAMSRRFELPPHSTWVNYIRVHDDIGWSFADEDAGELWINGFDHRRFLNLFYTGGFPGSFAKGLPFNYNPVNQDMRICGTAASLAGLERGLAQGNEEWIEAGVQRVIMLYSVILAAGGIPLIYYGDEIATLNDYSYTKDPTKANDSRWVHRPAFDWERAEQRDNPATIPGQVYQSLRQLIEIRKSLPAFDDERTLFFDTQNTHVLGFVRNGQVLVLANFSEYMQQVRPEVIAAYWNIPQRVLNLVTGESVDMSEGLLLEGNAFLWLSGTMV